MPALDFRLRAVAGWGYRPAVAEREAMAVVVAGDARLDPCRLARMPAIRMIACFNDGMTLGRDSLDGRD